MRLQLIDPASTGAPAFDERAGGGLLVVLLRSGDIGRVLSQSANEFGTYSHCTVLTRPPSVPLWLTVAAVTCMAPCPHPSMLIDTTAAAVREGLALHAPLLRSEIVVCNASIGVRMRALLSERDYALVIIGGTRGFGRARGVRRIMRAASTACSVVVVP